MKLSFKTYNRRFDEVAEALSASKKAYSGTCRGERAETLHLFADFFYSGSLFWPNDQISPAFVQRRMHLP